MAPPKFVIFDYDGTLFHTHQAISHCLAMTYQKHPFPHSLSGAELARLGGSGLGVEGVLKAMKPDPSTINEEEWIAEYRRLYSIHGQELGKPFDGAQHLLQFLNSRDIPIAVVSNKGATAIFDGLKYHGLADYIPEFLIVGNQTLGVPTKPDPASFFNVLAPALRERGILESVDPSDVFVVGDTEADIQFASNIGGAKSIFCRFGYGDNETCENMKPTAIIDSLAELEKLVDEL